eukprot:XP_001707896.1 Hypothetical protein GL50803_35096 [Giardia lamblia ATCC 50803]
MHLYASGSSCIMAVARINSGFSHLADFFSISVKLTNWKLSNLRFLALSSKIFIVLNGPSPNPIAIISNG